MSRSAGREGERMCAQHAGRPQVRQQLRLDAGAPVGSRRDPPQVSIVMPARDVAAFIDIAVASVLRQTVESWELIVIDDGSTDGTSAVVADIADSRIRLLRQAHCGATTARNLGVRESRGACVAFLDGDDVWEPAKLERHLAVLAANADVDLVFSHVRTIDVGGDPAPGPTRKGKGRISYRDLVVENLIRTSSSVVVRRSALEQAGPFDTRFDVCSDYDLWLRIGALRPRNVCCIPEPLTRYRSRPGQLTRNGPIIRDEWNRILAAADLPSGREGRRIRRHAQANLWRYLAFLAYREGRAGAGLVELAQGLAAAPARFALDPRNLAAVAACLGKLLLPQRLVARIERGLCGLGGPLGHGGVGGPP